MIYYELSAEERAALVEKLEAGIKTDLEAGRYLTIERFGSDSDTYMRRSVSRILGWLYRDRPDYRQPIKKMLKRLLVHPDEKVRQTMVYLLAEIGIVDQDLAFGGLESALLDESQMVRRGVVGALKRLGENNPAATLVFARRHLHSPDPEVRRIVIHGIELRGRTHPADILPVLQEREFDPSIRVQRMIIHVIGQASYKKGCLETVAAELKTWKNRQLVELALNEIIDVHERYESFSARTFDEALEFLKAEFPA